MKANSSAGGLCEDQLVLIRHILTFFSFDVNKRCKNEIESYYNNEKICSRFQGFCCPVFLARVFGARSPEFAARLARPSADP